MSGDQAPWCEEHHGGPGAMVKVIAPIEKRHIVHLIRITYCGIPRIRKSQQLGRGFDRKFKLAMCESPAKIVVIPALVVLPVESVAGGTHFPEVIRTDGNGHQGNRGPVPKYAESCGGS